jgi:coenzyme F420-dependent glucose-6-phosphate dehydrogenase
VQFGFWLTSEEHGPNELVRAAQHGEDAGFRCVQASDHFHPFVDRLENSP